MLEKNFDLPDVFNCYESAFEFCNNFLFHQKDIKIIGIALTSIYKEVFLNDQDDLTYGICKNLNISKPLNPKGKLLGYEILGYEYGCLHSYICNGLDDIYYDKYNLKLNCHGLISSLDEAKALSDYTNNEVDGTEPVIWLPWAIIEYPLV